MNINDCQTDDSSILPLAGRLIYYLQMYGRLIPTQCGKVKEVGAKKLVPQQAIVQSRHLQVN